MTGTRLPLLTASDIEAMAEVAHTHQFNDNAVRHTRSIGDVLGLEHLGVHLVRLEPGHDSTQFHYHHMDEEFVYILSGRGIAELGEETREVGAGDFMAFGRLSVPHGMSNPFDEDLVYLMGGSRSDIDICDYPRLGRRMYRIQGEKEYVDKEHLHRLETQK
ncbi:MAG: cupin domain-containing protein [Gammaproteobacteria bacterium]|nr:cupin domain-containing protein [Gammaproteobacteria bacterium]